MLRELQGMRQDHKEYREDLKKLSNENQEIKAELGLLRWRVNGGMVEERLEHIEKRIEKTI